VVLVRHRRAEQRHDAVTCELIDRPLELVHATDQDLEDPIEHAMPRLGPEPFG
jgi:hypothetical protein